MRWGQKQWGQNQWGQADVTPPVGTELAAQILTFGVDDTTSTGPTGFKRVVAFVWPAFRKQRPVHIPISFKVVALKE